MRHRGLTLFVAVICSFGISVWTLDAQEKKAGQTDWVEGYVRAVGEGTATPSGNRGRDQLRAVRAATILAQRALLEMVKELRIDSETTVEKRMNQEDRIHTHVEGTIRGAEIVQQSVRWDGDTPIATVELRICMGGVGACQTPKSIMNALALDHKDEPAYAPSRRLNEMEGGREAPIPQVREVVPDPNKPVTGVIFNLQGLSFSHEYLPVVITIGEGNKPFTVYSVKSVDPQTIRTYGVVRYAHSVEQARQNPHLGDNMMTIPVSGVTKENMIVIGMDAARLIWETTRHGNDYLKSAKVVIAEK